MPDIQVPVHAAESERALLGHLLDHPESFGLAAARGLRPEHFYERVPKVLAGALWKCAANGGIDRVAIATHLREAGTLDTPTRDALVSLDSEPAIPPSHVARHADAIVAKARARAIQDACRSTAALIQSGEEPATAVQSLRGVLEQQSQPAVSTNTARTNVELCEMLRGSGPRIPLGIQSIDDKLHGGIRAGKIMGIGGAPGSWKTSLCVQIADYLCQQHGFAVAWMAYDECAEEVMSRRLQARGLSRAQAEDPDDETMAMAAELDALPFRTYENRPLEEALAEFAREFPRAVRFAFVDSAQRAWTNDSLILTTARERIDCTLNTLRHLAEAPTTRCAVLMTSELARGAYRAKGAAEIDDLAAGKESGSIEYSMDVWCVLRVQGTGTETITMAIPKNRIGSKTDPENLLEFVPDRERVQLRQLSEAAKEELNARQVSDSLDKAKSKILKALRNAPQGLGADELREESRTRAIDCKRACRALHEAGLIEKLEVGKSHRITWRIVG